MGDACTVDVTRPEVRWVLASGWYLDAMRATDGLVLMSEPVSSDTAGPDAFYVERGSLKIPGRVLLSKSRRVLRFDPDDSLEPDADYTVRVNARLEDVAGNDAVPFSSGFDTTNAPDPALPADQVGTEAAGAAIPGGSAHDHAGFAVAAPGDVNFDGTGDLVIGAPDCRPAGAEWRGQGHAGVRTAAAAVERNAGRDAERWAAGGQAVGTVVARAGDLNGDNRADSDRCTAGRRQRHGLGKAYLVSGTKPGRSGHVESELPLCLRAADAVRRRVLGEAASDLGGAACPLRRR